MKNPFTVNGVEDKDLRKRYLRTLDTQEDRLEEMAQQRQVIQAKRLSITASLHHWSNHSENYASKDRSQPMRNPRLWLTS